MTSDDVSRVLIADDHHLSRQVLERNLVSWGFNVISVENGRQALDVLETGDAPPLAILDWRMPGLNGIEVCRRVREHAERPYTYLILLTSLSEKEQISQGLKAGADEYVIKPFSPQELRARLAVGQRLIRLERTLASQITRLEQTLSDVRKLKTLLPICMFCKRIRDDSDYWQQIEEYIHRNTGTDFSHGICPSCMAEQLAMLPGPEL